MDLPRFSLGLCLADVDNRDIALGNVVSRRIQDVGATQITFGLLCPSINVAEIAVGSEPLAGKEVGRAVVLKCVQDLVQIHGQTSKISGGKRLSFQPMPKTNIGRVRRGSPEPVGPWIDKTDTMTID